MTPETAGQAPGRIAGIDFGTKRIGIAITDRGRTIASPYENYVRGTQDQDAHRLQRLVEEEGIVLFVVGLPVHLDGRESEKSREARTFGVWLEEVTGVSVEFFDERFTSVEAESFMLDAKMTKKRRRARMDMVAAQIMLAAYVDSRRKATDEPGPLDDTTCQS